MSGPENLESGWYSNIFEPLGKSDATQPDSRNPTRDQDYVPSLRSRYRLFSHRTRGEIKTIFIFIGQTTKRAVLTRVQPNLTTSLNLITIVCFFTVWVGCFGTFLGPLPLGGEVLAEHSTSDENRGSGIWIVTVSGTWADQSKPLIIQA